MPRNIIIYFVVLIVLGVSTIFFWLSASNSGDNEVWHSLPSDSTFVTRRQEIRKAAEKIIPPKGSSSEWFEQNVLPLGDPSSWRQRRFGLHGSYGFVQFSGYRMGPSTFAVIGFAPWVMKKKHRLQGCRWEDGGGMAINGTTKLDWTYEWGAAQYGEVIIECELVGSTQGWGGTLWVRVDNEEWVGVVEERLKNEVSLTPSEPFHHHLVFGSSALHDKMVSQSVVEWIEYHRVVHSVEHFYIYDSGAVDDEMRAKLAPLLKAGFITITDLRATLLFSLYYKGQLLASMDCAYRSRYTAKWVCIQDVDQYTHVVPPRTLSGILGEHEGQSWLNHGGIWMNISVCTRVEEGGFAVESMVNVDTSSGVPFCRVKKDYPEVTCVSGDGQRKFCLDPRRVRILSIHNVDDGSNGVTLNSLTEMRHFHYRGLGATSSLASQCNTTAPERGLQKDEVAVLASRARKCPLGSSKRCFGKTPGFA